MFTEVIARWAMKWHDYVILSVYAVLTIALIVLKICRIGSRRRGVVKMLTAATFLVLGIFGCINHRGGLSIILCVGLLFAALGDLLLVFMDDNRKMFVAGVFSFSAASTLLSVYALLQYGSNLSGGWYFIAIALFAVIMAVNIVCQKFNYYNYGKLVVHLNVYLALVSVCGSLGLSFLCLGTSNLPMFFFGLGCFMYLSSDICLGLYMFKFKNRFVDAVNSALYFPGMLFVALSLLVG